MNTAIQPWRQAVPLWMSEDDLTRNARILAANLNRPRRFNGYLEGGQLVLLEPPLLAQQVGATLRLGKVDPRSILLAALDDVTLTLGIRPSAGILLATTPFMVVVGFAGVALPGTRLALGPGATHHDPIWLAFPYGVPMIKPHWGAADARPGLRLLADACIEMATGRWALAAARVRDAAARLMLSPALDASLAQGALAVNVRIAIGEAHDAGRDPRLERIGELRQMMALPPGPPAPTRAH